MSIVPSIPRESADARFIAQLAALRDQAEAGGQGMLRYLLDLALLEAERNGTRMRMAGSAMMEKGLAARQKPAGATCSALRRRTKE